MKCQEIDYIAYMEGRAAGETESHMAGCPACREELERFSLFMNGILPVYREGKRQEAEIERRLAEMDLEKLKPLPPGIAKKVKALRKKRLVSRLKRVIGENTQNTRIWIESILNPQMAALPAIPKDITKTGKDKPKRKKVVSTGRKPGKKGNGGNMPK